MARKGMWIPRAIWEDKRIGWMEKLIWAEIDSFHENGKECFQSNEVLAELFQLSVRQVQRNLKKLSDLGLITILIDKSANKRYLLPGDKIVADVATKMTSATVINVVEIKDTLFNMTDSITVEIGPTFDEFWKKYDKKIDRPLCETAWSKLRIVTRELIMEHLEKYIESEPNKEFRRNPLTYLRRKHWLNEIITKKSAAGIVKAATGTSRVTQEGTINRINQYDN